MLIAFAAFVLVLALGGAGFAYAGMNRPSKKRLDAFAKSVIAVRPGAKADPNSQRRRNMQVALKELDEKRAQTEAKAKERLTTRRRLEIAGVNITPRTYWIGSGVLGAVIVGICLLTGQSLIVALLASFAAALGLPRWALSFLKNRREKSFTEEFANAIDVVVRSVRTGLPTNEALKIVASEVPDPVGGEFTRLCEGMKVGMTLEQGLKKMYDSMPTAEVSFFSIVMAIQQKSGGNLSEALNNLAGVLRDRKRLIGKIKAMSSEAKASAMIIGSLPPGVMGIVYVTTPSYITLLFTERLGNLMLAGCAVWMGIGIFVMRQMINFKH
jgi:tight adherence protein B